LPLQPRALRGRRAIPDDAGALEIAAQLFLDSKLPCDLPRTVMAGNTRRRRPWLY